MSSTNNPPPATTCPHKLPCGLCNISHSPCSQLPTTPAPAVPENLNGNEANFNGKDYNLKCTTSSQNYGNPFDGA